MKATQALHDQGQSIWLDNITRDLLDAGTVARYIAGIDIDALAARLQDEGAKSFVSSWNELMDVIAAKSAGPKSANAG